MSRTIHPGTALAGSVALPGDKSISHRYALLASMAEGRSVLSNYATGQDCYSTLGCLRSLGVPWESDAQGRILIEGMQPDGFKAPTGRLDAGNSGTTMRLLTGVLCGRDFDSRIVGDSSLSKRPMRRILEPLGAMGAVIEAREGEFPPLTVRAGNLQPIRYQMPVASAQVKSAVLLAALRAPGPTTVIELAETRDHSEIALRRFGAVVRSDGREITIQGQPALSGCDINIPGDLSSAVFFIGGALLLPGSDLRIERVCMNPTRTAVLGVLERMGAQIEVEPLGDEAGEPVGTIRVRGGATLAGGEIAGDLTAAVIDEIPMLAVLGAVSANGLQIRDARELRVKETDRIATVAKNLRRMGVEVSEHESGIDISGRSELRPAVLDSYGDHRIAMAFAVAATAADGESTLENAEAASVSFPKFYETLARVVQ